jgi:hypothetical protein
MSTADEVRGVLLAIVSINAVVSRTVQFLLDGSLPADEEIAIGNALARGGRALERHGKKRLASEARANNAAAGS